MNNTEALRKLGDITRLVNRFAAFDHKMQLSTMLTFLEIAKADLLGKHVSTRDLQESIGLRSGTSSRNVYYWADGTADMVGSHRMVDVRIDPKDRRLRVVKLNAKGRAFLNHLLSDVDAIFRHEDNDSEAVGP